jgi:hypothetical protein
MARDRSDHGRPRTPEAGVAQAVNLLVGVFPDIASATDEIAAG